MVKEFKVKLFQGSDLESEFFISENILEDIISSWKKKESIFLDCDVKSNSPMCGYNFKNYDLIQVSEVQDE